MNKPAIADLVHGSEFMVHGKNMAFDFEKLDVYHEALNFADSVYELTMKFPRGEVHGLTGQLRRAAVSIATNIAEGSGRSKKEFVHYLKMARTSVYECVP